MKTYSELLKQVSREPDNLQTIIDVSVFLDSLNPVCGFEVARDLLKHIKSDKIKNIIEKQVQGHYQANDIEALETYLVPDGIDLIKDIERKLYSGGLISIDGTWIIAHGTRKQFAAYAILLIRSGYFKRTIQLNGRRAELKESDCIKFMRDRYQFKEQTSFNIEEPEARELFPFILDLNLLSK